MAAAWGDPKVCLGRELTKMHEEVLRGSASAVAGLLSRRPGVKGEIAIAAAPAVEGAARETSAPESCVVSDEIEDPAGGPVPDDPDDPDDSDGPDRPESPSRE